MNHQNNRTNIKKTRNYYKKIMERNFVESLFEIKSALCFSNLR